MYPGVLVHLPLQTPCPEHRQDLKGGLLSPLLSCHLNHTHDSRAHGSFASGPFVLVTHTVAAEPLLQLGLSCGCAGPIVSLTLTPTRRSPLLPSLFSLFPPSNLSAKLKVMPQHFIKPSMKWERGQDGNRLIETSSQKTIEMTSDMVFNLPSSPHLHTLLPSPTIRTLRKGWVTVHMPSTCIISRLSSLSLL